ASWRSYHFPGKQRNSKYGGCRGVPAGGKHPIFRSLRRRMADHGSVKVGPCRAGKSTTSSCGASRRTLSWMWARRGPASKDYRRMFRNSVAVVMVLGMVGSASSAAWPDQLFQEVSKDFG